MPYITKDRRPRAAQQMDATGLEPGELAFRITHDLVHWAKGGDYARLALALGIIESVKLEFVRRVIVPYEERKRLENGDVY